MRGWRGRDSRAGEGEDWDEVREQHAPQGHRRQPRPCPGRPRKPATGDEDGGNGFELARHWRQQRGHAGRTPARRREQALAARGSNKAEGIPARGEGRIPSRIQAGGAARSVAALYWARTRRSIVRRGFLAELQGGVHPDLGDRHHLLQGDRLRHRAPGHRRYAHAGCGGSRGSLPRRPDRPGHAAPARRPGPSCDLVALWISPDSIGARPGAAGCALQVKRTNRRPCRGTGRTGPPAGGGHADAFLGDDGMAAERRPKPPWRIALDRGDGVHVTPNQARYGIGSTAPSAPHRTRTGAAAMLAAVRGWVA